LAFRQIERTTGQQLQTPLQPVQDGVGWQYPGSGSRQFNRQRQSIQPQTDFLHRGCIFSGDGKIGPDGCGTLCE
jgi:hypothetical protein